MAKLRPSRGRAARGVDGWSRRTRRITLAAVAGLSVVLLTSCSTLGPDTTAATGVASAFHRAVRDGDGNAACALLAPATVEDLEGSSGQSCPDAILTQDLPHAQDVQDTQAFGRAAKVSMDSDVVFLSVFGDPVADHGGRVHPTRRPTLRLHPQGRLSDADRVLELPVGHHDRTGLFRRHRTAAPMTGDRS